MMAFIPIFLVMSLLFVLFLCRLSICVSSGLLRVFSPLKRHDAMTFRKIVTQLGICAVAALRYHGRFAEIRE